MFFSVFGDVLEWHRWVGFLFLFLFSSLHFTLAIADQNQGEKRENQGEGLTTDWRLLFHFPGVPVFPFASEQGMAFVVCYILDACICRF